ncbi:hypothetical protein HW555_006465, partial [Spodoptera exigua]
MPKEENQLVQWIIESCRKGFPRRKEDVIQSVKLFLIANPRSNSFIENTPGEGWYKHPEVALRTSEAVTSASSKISESNIRSWFTQIENYLKENNLFHILSDPSRVYNGDETNFILCPKNTKVIAPKGEKNVYEVDHAPSKSCITACGLCPFNPDEVDYTKCLMPAKPQRAILDDMNYQIFQEIVGPQLIRKMKAQVVAKSVEAEKLFEIYKYLAPKHSAQNSFSLAEPSTNPDEIPESMDCSTDVSDIVIHEDYEVFNQNIAFAHEMEICTSEPTINPEAIFEYQKENVPNDASTTESEIPVSDLPYALSTTNDSSMDRTTKTPE